MSGVPVLPGLPYVLIFLLAIINQIPGEICSPYLEMYIFRTRILMRQVFHTAI